MTEFSLRQSIDPIDDYVDATIADGQTESGIVDMYSYRVVGLITDANFAGTQLTFNVYDTNVGTPTPHSLTEDGVAVSVAIAAAGDAANILPTRLAGWRYLSVVSDVAQAGSASVVTLVCRPV